LSDPANSLTFARPAAGERISDQIPIDSHPDVEAPALVRACG
jgi:hypothetical protein